jgi:hypothetical protein
MSELLHAVGMETVEGSYRSIGANIPLNGSDQLFKDLVALEEFDGVRLGRAVVAFDFGQEFIEAGFDRLLFCRVLIVAG